MKFPQDVPPYYDHAGGYRTNATRPSLPRRLSNTSAVPDHVIHIQRRSTSPPLHYTNPRAPPRPRIDRPAGFRNRSGDYFRRHSNEQGGFRSQSPDAGRRPPYRAEYQRELIPPSGPAREFPAPERDRINRSRGSDGSFSQQVSHERRDATNSRASSGHESARERSVSLLEGQRIRAEQGVGDLEHNRRVSAPVSTYNMNRRPHLPIPETTLDIATPPDRLFSGDHKSTSSPSVELNKNDAPLRNIQALTPDDSTLDKPSDTPPTKNAIDRESLLPITEPPVDDEAHAKKHRAPEHNETYINPFDLMDDASSVDEPRTSLDLESPVKQNEDEYESVSVPISEGSVKEEETGEIEESIQAETLPFDTTESRQVTDQVAVHTPSSPSGASEASTAHLEDPEAFAQNTNEDFRLPGEQHETLSLANGAVVSSRGLVQDREYHNQRGSDETLLNGNPFDEPAVLQDEPLFDNDGDLVHSVNTDLDGLSASSKVTRTSEASDRTLPSPQVEAGPAPTVPNDSLQAEVTDVLNPHSGDNQDMESVSMPSTKSEAINGIEDWSMEGIKLVASEDRLQSPLHAEIESGHQTDDSLESGQLLDDDGDTAEGVSYQSDSRVPLVKDSVVPENIQEPILPNMEQVTESTAEMPEHFEAWTFTDRRNGNAIEESNHRLNSVKIESNPMSESEVRKDVTVHNDAQRLNDFETREEASSILAVARPQTEDYSSQDTAALPNVARSASLAHSDIIDDTQRPFVSVHSQSQLDIKAQTHQTDLERIELAIDSIKNELSRLDGRKALITSLRQNAKEQLKQAAVARANFVTQSFLPVKKFCKPFDSTIAAKIIRDNQSISVGQTIIRRKIFRNPQEFPRYQDTIDEFAARKGQLMQLLMSFRNSIRLEENDMREEYEARQKKWLRHAARCDRQRLVKIDQQEAETANANPNASAGGSRGTRNKPVGYEVDEALSTADIPNNVLNEAVIPKRIADPFEREMYSYVDLNCLVVDPLRYYYISAPDPGDVWSEEEQNIFFTRYKANPKQFGIIADGLPGRSAQDCVLHYYKTKKILDYRTTGKLRAKNAGRGRGRGKKVVPGRLTRRTLLASTSNTEADDDEVADETEVKSLRKRRAINDIDDAQRKTRALRKPVKKKPVDISTMQASGPTPPIPMPALVEKPNTQLGTIETASTMPPQRPRQMPLQAQQNLSTNNQDLTPFGARRRSIWTEHEEQHFVDLLRRYGTEWHTIPRQYHIPNKGIEQYQQHFDEFLVERGYRQHLPRPLNPGPLPGPSNYSQQASPTSQYPQYAPRPPILNPSHYQSQYPTGPAAQTSSHNDRSFYSRPPFPGDSYMNPASQNYQQVQQFPPFDYRSTPGRPRNSSGPHQQQHQHQQRQPSIGRSPGFPPRASIDSMLNSGERVQLPPINIRNPPTQPDNRYNNYYNPGPSSHNNYTQQQPAFPPYHSQQPSQDRYNQYPNASNNSHPSQHQNSQQGPYNRGGGNNHPNWR